MKIMTKGRKMGWEHPYVIIYIGFFKLLIMLLVSNENSDETIQRESYGKRWVGNIYVL